MQGWGVCAIVVRFILVQHFMNGSRIKRRSQLANIEAIENVQATASRDEELRRKILSDAGIELPLSVDRHALECDDDSADWSSSQDSIRQNLMVTAPNGKMLTIQSYYECASTDDECLEAHADAILHGANVDWDSCPIAVSHSSVHFDDLNFDQTTPNLKHIQRILSCMISIFCHAVSAPHLLCMIGCRMRATNH